MTDTIPEFDADGLLPPGDYEVTLGELRNSSLVVGPNDGSRVPNWDASWRGWLVDHLEMMVKQLWQVSITEIFIDGSFAEDKEHPNDIDGYFVCELNHLASGALQRELNLQDSQKVWTWDPASRKPYAGYPKAQLPMWHGNELEFPAAFRRSRRDGRPRGIIKLIQEPNHDS